MPSHLLRYQSSAAHSMLKAAAMISAAIFYHLFAALLFAGICIDRIRQNRTGILRSFFPWDYQHIGVKK